MLLFSNLLLYSMKSSFRLKALIVELPEIDSERKASRGDLETDSILLTSLVASIVNLNNTRTTSSMTGNSKAIHGTTQIDITIIESSK